NMRIGADQHEPRRILQRVEQLAAERMPLHHLDVDRHGPWLRHEQADIHRASFARHVDLREIVDARRKPLVDRDEVRGVELHQLAEGRERRLAQRGNGYLVHGPRPAIFGGYLYHAAAPTIAPGGGHLIEESL